MLGTLVEPAGIFLATDLSNLVSRLELPAPFDPAPAAMPAPPAPGGSGASNVDALANAQRQGRLQRHGGLIGSAAPARRPADVLARADSTASPAKTLGQPMTGTATGVFATATRAQPAQMAIDPNGRFATTYRPGRGHLARFEFNEVTEIVQRGEEEALKVLTSHAATGDRFDRLGGAAEAPIRAQAAEEPAAPAPAAP